MIYLKSYNEHVLQMKESGWYCQSSACYTSALQGGSLQIAFIKELGHTEWRNRACWQQGVSYLFTFNLQASGMLGVVGMDHRLGGGAGAGLVGSLDLEKCSSGVLWPPEWLSLPLCPVQL